MKQVRIELILLAVAAFIVGITANADIVGNVDTEALMPSRTGNGGFQTLAQKYAIADKCIAEKLKSCTSACSDSALYEACQGAAILSRDALLSRIRGARLLSRPYSRQLVAKAEFCLQSPTGKLYAVAADKNAVAEANFLNNEFGPSDSGARWYVVGCD